MSRIPSIANLADFPDEYARIRRWRDAEASGRVLPGSTAREIRAGHRAAALRAERETARAPKPWWKR